MGETSPGVIQTPAIAIITPLRAGESVHPDLKAQIAELEKAGDPAFEWVIVSRGDRAASLNAGVDETTAPILWFLHADSRIPPGCLTAIATAVHANPRALYYFDLAFHQETAIGSLPMHLNAWGANLRSRYFGVPFGDQGLACHRDLFADVGGFPSHARYGEDHLFVWYARRLGYQVRPIDLSISTSARGYVDHGWLRTTALYQWRWLSQAAGQLMAMALKRPLAHSMRKRVKGENDSE